MVDLQNEYDYKSRPYTGQIVNIDEEAGKATVRLIGSHEQYVCDIPVQGLSMRGIFSSWQRHMPQKNDYVELAWGPRSEPKILRITSWLFGQNNGGYATIAAAAARGDGNLNLIWRKLRQGEFDLRSRGGAGYYFTADGHATLSAGATSIELDKNRSESFGNAGLWVRRGDGVEVRHGDVKRLLPLTFSETSAVVNPLGALAPKEWSVTVGALTPAGVLPFYTERAGDVRDATGLPIAGVAMPLRYQKKLYNAAGLVETFSVEADAIGNLKVIQAPSALAGIDLSLVAGPLAVRALSSSLSTVLKNVVASDLPIQGVYLGSAGASQSVTWGVPLVAQLTALTGQVTVLAAAVGVAATALSTAPGTGLNPPGQALLATLGVAATGLAAGLGGVATALGAAPGTLFSLKVLTE